MTAVFIFILKQTSIKKQGPPFDDPETSFDNLVNEKRQRYKQILIRQYYLIIRTTPYVKFSFHLSFIHGMPWDVYHLTRATITSLFPLTPVTTAIDIKSDYDEKCGAPSAGYPKVFFRYFYVNTATGEKSGEKMASAVLSA